MEDILYKGYKIKSMGDYPLKIITAKSQGQVPIQLRGKYTDTFTAKKSIDLYLSSLIGKKKKVIKNDENNNSS